MIFSFLKDLHTRRLCRFFWDGKHMGSGFRIPSFDLSNFLKSQLVSKHVHNGPRLNPCELQDTGPTGLLTHSRYRSWKGAVDPVTQSRGPPKPASRAMTGRTMKADCWASLWTFHFHGTWVGLRPCFSNRFPGDAALLPGDHTWPPVTKSPGKGANLMPPMDLAPKVSPESPRPL